MKDEQGQIRVGVRDKAKIKTLEQKLDEFDKILKEEEDLGFQIRKVKPSAGKIVSAVQAEVNKPSEVHPEYFLKNRHTGIDTAIRIKSREAELIKKMDEFEESRKTFRFPLSALPKKLQQICLVFHEQLSFPVEYSAASMLCVASVAIGNSHITNISWREGVNLFVSIVGKPGIRKSHPVSSVVHPLQKMDNTFVEEYLNALDEYEKDRDNVQKPLLKKIVMGDASMASLKEALHNNPRGILMYRDELNAWLTSFKKYDSVEDWLQLFSRKDILYNRKNVRPLLIKSPCVSVLGTIQHDLLDEMAKANNLKNGFLERILFVLPENMTTKRNKVKPNTENEERQWEQIIFKLYSIECPTPTVVDVTDEAGEVIAEWDEAMRNEDLEIYGEEHRVTSKISTYLPRFCLIIQLLRWACGEADRNAIDVDTVQRAIALAKYFKATGIEVYEHVTKKNPIERLEGKRELLYYELPDSFSSAVGVQIAKTFGMSERTFRGWLTGTPELFRCERHGVYGKVIKRYSGQKGGA